MATTCAAAAAERSAPPVDLVHLVRNTFGNRDLEQEVLRLFERQSKVYLDRIKQAADATQRRDAVHTIKGSARGIGAWKVANIAEKLETGQIFSPLELEGAIDETNAFIRDLLGEH